MSANNEGKTLGQVARSAYEGIVYHAYPPELWWETVAQSVIAEYERRKANTGLLEVAAAMDERNRPDPNAACKLALDQGKRIQRSMPSGQWATAATPQWYHHIEYRVHPDDVEPEWKLPDPPQGEQYHRTDWTQDMLPEGYRPLLIGERPVVGVDHFLLNGRWIAEADCHDHLAMRDVDLHQRTTRPIQVKSDPYAECKVAFEAGKRIQFTGRDYIDWTTCRAAPGWCDDCEYRVHPDDVKEKPDPFAEAKQWLAEGRLQFRWDDGEGWRDWEGIYATEPSLGWGWKQNQFRRRPDLVMVPLEPDDVPPGSVFRMSSGEAGWQAPLEVHERGVEFGDCEGLWIVIWEQLLNWKINRNDGKGWVACSKEEARP